MNRLPTFLIGALAPAWLGACAPAAGTRPHDMSAANHQTAAEAEEAQAEQHAEQHDPKAMQKTCTRKGTERQACWSDSESPTAEHDQQAREHRELAAKHRAAAAALATAEASACQGIGEMDRDMSPFAHEADIRSVDELRVTVRDSYGEDDGVERQHLVGATVVFDAVPGMTAEWLQKVVDCHLARNAALGHDVPEMSYCPLVPKGVTAKVRSVGNGFAVDIQSNDEATIKEVLRRSRTLGPSSP